MADNPPRHRFSVADYEKMVEHAILTENDRVELIRGLLLEKPDVSSPHAACVIRLNRLLVPAINERGIVSVGDPVGLADSVPEPDVALLRPRTDFYASARPQPKDILLVVEVADSTVDYDREDKSALYAENGITEYWIVNLPDRCLEVYRQPRPDGTYADVRTLRPGDTADVAALPGVTVAVADIL
jgi:Uma2 family endonuclease